MSKLVPAVAAVAVFGFSFLFGFAVSQSGGPKSDEEIQAWIDKEVTKSNKVLPMDCGNGVTWFRIEAGDKSLNYSYKIDASARQIVANQARFEQALKNFTLLQWMLPDEVHAYASMYDRGGNLVCRVPMNH